MLGADCRNLAQGPHSDSVCPLDGKDCGDLGKEENNQEIDSPRNLSENTVKSPDTCEHGRKILFRIIAVGVKSDHEEAE